MDSSLKFPDLTDGKDLDTLEYSHNKDDLSLSRLEMDGKRLIEAYQSKEQTFDKYLMRTNDPEENNEETQKMEKKHKQSNFTLGKADFDRNEYQISTAVNSRPGLVLFIYQF